MAAQTNSRRKYSWWWDSHISPKNSKWLQENLTDMDSNVKTMIKLIEEDADSFARRAEMYYKKRPELMKLVEEFYRAYRALAERYDHATGVIRQAHQTMAAAFPNQAPFGLSDESPGSANDADPHTPEMTNASRALFDTDDSSQFHAAKRNGGFTEDSDTGSGRKGLKQFNDMFGSGDKFSNGRARKGLNFHAFDDENGRSDRMDKAETEISNLKKALAKLESEKEAGLLQYEQSLERLSNLESEVSRAQNNSKDLNERANKAEAEVQNLKEALAKFQAEREAYLVQYQNYAEKISNLENSLVSAEKDSDSLKQDMKKLGAEKEVALSQYKSSLEHVSELEGKLLQAEEDAVRIIERADKAGCELGTLKQLIEKLTVEKEAAVMQYLQCLETISSLESKLSRAEDEAERLNLEIINGAMKLKGAEEKCIALESSNQTLQSELVSLVNKVGSQDEELTEKQKEMGRLWTCIHDERMRFVEAETAFQTLQHLHTQSQEELRSLIAELQNKVNFANEMKDRNQGLEDEVRKVLEDNKDLNELNLASALSIKTLQDDISGLRGTIRRLEEEVELRVDERNALQQEIYCLKEQLNEFNKKYLAMIEQVESIGYNPESFGSSVKELLDESTKLKVNWERSETEKLNLLEQLKVMDKLKETKALLENSLADLNDELEGVREKVKALEHSCQSLLEEKSSLAAQKTSLISQLQVTNENLEKMSVKNNVLENSLFDAEAELEGLRAKSKSLEDSCLLLDGEKSGLVTEKECLFSQLEISQKTLEDLGNRYALLEVKLSVLEHEKQKALSVIKELKLHLDAEKKQYVNFTHLSEAQLASREVQIRDLQEESICRKKEYDDEQENALKAHIQILILLQFIEGLEEKNLSFLVEHQKVVEESDKSKKLVSRFEHEIIRQKEERDLLSEQNKVLRTGIYQLMKALDICEISEVEQDERLFNRILVKIQERDNSLSTSSDENQRLMIENSVLVTILEQIESEFRIQSTQLLSLLTEKQKLCVTNEEFKRKIEDGDRREEVLTAKSEDLQKQLLNSEVTVENILRDHSKLLAERSSWMLTIADMEEQKRCLEDDNDAMFGETVYFSNLSLVSSDVISKNLVDFSELGEKLTQLQRSNIDLDEKAQALEEKLEGLRRENLQLKEVWDTSNNELTTSRSVNDQLKGEIVDANELVFRKENEIRVWEGQADLLFAELQMSHVCGALLEGKIKEIAEECSSKGSEIGALERKLSVLEEANGGLHAQLAAYSSAVHSLKTGVASLERLTLQEEHSQLDNGDSEGICLTTQGISQEDEIPSSSTVEPDSLFGLEDLQSRVRAIEMAVTEKENIATMENFTARTKLDAAMKEIEELKAKGNTYREDGETSRQEDLRDVPNKNLRVRTRRKTQEICEAGSDVLTKDIVLDQMSSDCSSFGRSKREMAVADSHLLELWETVDRTGSIDLKVKAKAHKRPNPSVESLIEKELGVDKLELSRRISEPRQQGSKRSVLDRLDSDSQKLSNLRITVTDLKRKVEATEKSKKGKAIEHETVREQLAEAEEAISKLFETNRRLVKGCEEVSQASSEGIPGATPDESSGGRRRRVSEQAKRGSEKIGRLQLEVQRLQFLLLKMDGDEKERGRPRIPDHSSRVLLRDYLYGGTVRTVRKQKRAPFCSCVQPPTKGD